MGFSRKSSNMSKAGGDSEVHISLSDQQKINKFARLNNRLEDLKEDLKSKKNELQTLEDAGTDLMMLEDYDEKVPYQVGEVFVYLSQDKVQSELDARKEEVEAEVKVSGRRRPPSRSRWPTSRRNCTPSSAT